MIRDWFKSALCIGVRPDVFFPSASAYSGYTEARYYCGRCPVAAQCLAYAVDNHITYGMWGGYMPDERAGLRPGQTPITPGGTAHGSAGGTYKGYWRERRAKVEPCAECKESYNAYKRDKRQAKTQIGAAA